VLAAAEPDRAPRRRRVLRARSLVLVAAAAVSLGTVVPQLGWVDAQFDRFHASVGVDMADATVVAHLRQHDGTVLEIAEKTFATAGAPTMRCVAIRPPAPADPVAAPSDPLSFGGDAFCTRVGTMGAVSTWQDDGSGSLLARRPDRAAGIELRAGASSWKPSSADGPWALFTVGPGSIPPDAAVSIVALDLSGHEIATEPVAR
jgi:hypothetical protein